MLFNTLQCAGWHHPRENDPAPMSAGLLRNPGVERIMALGGRWEGRWLSKHL